MEAMFDQQDYESKICPLSGEEIGPECYFPECRFNNCSNVSKSTAYYIYGHIYHCDYEKRVIEDWHERQMKAAELYKRMNLSLETARTINIDDFFSYCDSLDKEMVNNRQTYNRDMMINPYHDPDEKCLIYIFENDEINEISVVDNPFVFLGSRFDRIKNGSLSICAVPAYMAEAINVRLHLQYKMDVKAILHNDNPVYIKARNIAKYVEAAYGWDWLSFKRVRDRHLEMTEIVNYENIIYIKQELDEIVRQESTRK